MFRVSQSRVRARYESLLRRSMELVGVDGSIERKILMAVGIQFLVSGAQFLLPFAVSGVARFLLAGGVFLAAAVAFLNTVLVVRRDFVEPIRTLEGCASDIATGDLSGEIDRVDQADEIGSLSRSFADMQAYLDTVSDQADALARQEFDAPVLEEDVPGNFGDALDRMATSLREYTTELETLVGAFGEAAGRARDGDLTATIDPTDVGLEGDHAVEVIRNYNALVETLADTLAEAQRFADEVSTASDGLTTSMDEIDGASDEIARSVQGISEGASEQTDRLGEVAEEMDTLSATVEEIAASADEVAETAEEAADRSQSGRDAAEQAIAELDELEAHISETATAVERLVDQVEAVGDIAAFIDEVAEQTNLLALNASVEAAHADEGGGFAVVADEIKGLAEETRASAEEIGDRIEAVQSESASAVADVREMERRVSESVASIEDTLRDFEDIAGVIGDLNVTVQEISEATSEQAQTTQDVVEMTDEVAAVSSRTSDDAETVAAATQQQTASVSEITANLRSLDDRAEQLQSALDRFTIDSDPRASGERPQRLARSQH